MAMNAKASLNSGTIQPFQRDLLSELDPAVCAQAVAASGDLVLIIDGEGVICDLALNSEELARDGVSAWLDRRWADTVTDDSRHKIDELLRDARAESPTRWREVNHVSPFGDPFTVRYLVIDAGLQGRMIAIGRDHRATGEMQQRLIRAQQAMERDYSRLRDAESRHRLLFQMSGEAVLIVDVSTRKVLEANPAADLRAGVAKGGLVDQPFARIFDSDSHEAAVSLLTVAQSSARSGPTQATLKCNGRESTVSASLFRQDRVSLFLVRLSAVADAETAAPDAGSKALEVLERLPDAFVVTDEALRIVTVNAAFLDLARVGSKEQAKGVPLDRFVGRPGVDRNILLDSLRTHGSVRNFNTVLRNQYNEQEDVEISAVALPDMPEPCLGFTIRSVGRRLYDNGRTAPGLKRSVEELTELVGRVAMKDLVRETTELVERLCIEAALELTGNNRASAAEILGLSRQSLYSKLHRLGVGDFATGEG